MNIKVGISIACLLTGATLANAQTTVDRSFTSKSNDCSAVQWSERALEMYPTIAEACQSVEERNGKKYVKFQGTLKRNERGERIVVDFKDGGELTLTPPPETSVYIDGRRTPVARLQRGDELNFYIAEDRLAAQFPEAETQTARFVIVPIAVQEAPQETQQMTASLPSTASWLPLLAIGGVLALMFGSLLALFRYRS